MTTVKVWIKKPGQNDGAAVPVDLSTGDIIYTLKERYLEKLKGPTAAATLVLKYNNLELDNRRTYQSYLDDSAALANGILVAEDGGNGGGGSGGWLRDLVRECVEPNPGPSLSEVTTCFAKKAKLAADDARITILEKLITDLANTKYPEAEDAQKHFVPEMIDIVFEKDSEPDRKRLVKFMQEAIKEMSTIQKLTNNINSREDTRFSEEEMEEFRCYKRAKTAPPLFRSSYVYYYDQNSFVITQSNKQKLSVPAEFVGPAAAYMACGSESTKENFVTNFVESLKITTTEDTSPYKLPSIWWGQAIQHVAKQLAHNVYLLEKGELHCSNVLVGMMGVGKTTIIRYVAVLAALLSSRLVSVYIDITSVDESPLDILKSAFVTAGLMDADKITHIADMIDYVVEKDARLLIIFDEAHKYYSDNNATPTQIKQSKAKIQQLYTLGTSRNCMVVLCGSSSKLPVLALQDTSTASARSLLSSYPVYDSLNHSKFSSLALNALRWDEMPNVTTQYLNLPGNAALQIWTKTGGSMRYIRKDKELPPKVPERGPEMLVMDYLASQQPENVDATNLTTISVEELHKAIERWGDEGIDTGSSLIYEMVDQLYLSSYYDNQDVLCKVGFSHPAQYTQLLARYKLSSQLTKQQREMLVDPKAFGERLELFVMSCIQKETQKLVVLCMTNKASSDIKEPHTDILIREWDPLGKHREIKIYKIWPDSYGVDMLSIVNITEAAHPTAKNRTASVEINKYQIKLGGSDMSIGTNTKKKEKENKTKQDTVAHACERSLLSIEVDKVVKEAFNANKIVPNMVFVVTRGLSANARTHFEKYGKLLDRAYLRDYVWPVSVVEYAKSVPIDWIFA